MSAFGDGYGVQPSQFECPDMVQLPVNGDVNIKKWALIVNINPGCLFGGSATQYLSGDFDGTKFVCDTKPIGSTRILFLRSSTVVLMLCLAN